MNKDQFESKWEELKSEVKQKWEKITTDDIENIHGKKDKLIAKLRERYGFNSEKAKSEFEVFMNDCNCESNNTSHHRVL
jgi:uncharacterized protein YjbJ (UPF0337 family)